jgi:hypothetical protein
MIWGRRRRELDQRKGRYRSLKVRDLVEAIEREAWPPGARCVQVESPGCIVPGETSTAGARECDQVELCARFHLIAFRSSDEQSGTAR